MEKLGVKIVVSERHGMRRFLYPMRVKLPSLYRRLVGSLAVAEADGKPVPSAIEVLDNGEVSCLFALSLAPFETRDLLLMRLDSDEADESASIPDAISISEDEDGFVATQERIEFEIGSMAQLASVVYDGEQHLSGPLGVTLDGHVAEPAAEGYRPQLSKSLNGGLGARFTHGGVYADAVAGQPQGQNELELTACKSWVWARHTLTGVYAGGLLRFTLPLTVTSPVQTCDFGIGSGAYGKIEPGVIDEIVWKTDFSSGRMAKYEITTHRAGQDKARTDYAGEIKSSSEAASKLWLHWVEPTKSIAVAVTEYPKQCRRIAFRLSDRGVVAVEFETGELRAATDAVFGVCFHFLNAVPAIAAATNPASILLTPSATVMRSS